MNKQNSKGQSRDDKRLFIVGLICIFLVIASFISSLLLLDYAFTKMSLENQSSFHDLQVRIREVNMRLQNDSKNEDEIKNLEEINRYYR